MPKSDLKKSNEYLKIDRASCHLLARTPQVESQIFQNQDFQHFLWFGCAVKYYIENQSKEFSKKSEFMFVKIDFTEEFFFQHLSKIEFKAISKKSTTPLKMFCLECLTQH